MKQYEFIFLGYLVIVNIFALVLMWIDKEKAKKHRWRIPEATLFLPVILGGAFGGSVGMYMFHHKTKKWKFKLGYPFFLVLWIVVILCFKYKII